MMVSIIPLLIFHIGSLYLSYEDIKARSVTLWVLMLTLIAGVFSFYPIALTFDLLISCALFLTITLIITFLKKVQAIAWADMAYFFVIILNIQDLWWQFFVCIGILSIALHYASGKAKDLPFIAVLYGAYFVVKLFSIV